MRCTFLMKLISKDCLHREGKGRVYVSTKGRTRSGAKECFLNHIPFYSYLVMRCHITSERYTEANKLGSKLVLVLKNCTPGVQVMDVRWFCAEKLLNFVMFFLIVFRWTKRLYANQSGECFWVAKRLYLFSSAQMELALTGNEDHLITVHNFKLNRGGMEYGHWQNLQRESGWGSHEAGKKEATAYKKQRKPIRREMKRRHRDELR